MENISQVLPQMIGVIRYPVAPPNGGAIKRGSESSELREEDEMGKEPPHPPHRPPFTTIYSPSMSVQS